MELRELKSFVAAVEEGGMSAAARRLHVSQSALSQTINSLEREVGVKLLVRSSAGVRPTEAGITLLGEARAVLARYAQAVRTMADYTAEGSGVIRLGIPFELPPSVLPRRCRGSQPTALMHALYPATCPRPHSSPPCATMT
jgi:DNA-binding transcriptional LysR family regulator